MNPSFNDREQDEEDIPFLQDSLLVNSVKKQKSIMKWINRDNLKSELLYRGTRDGFSALTFFNPCATAGPTITLIRSKEKKHVFGGFAARSWQIPRN